MSASDTQVPIILPADVAAVKSMGVENWQHQMSWPLSDQEFWSIAETAHALYDRQLAALEESHPEMADVFLADTTFLNQMIQALHIAAAQARAARSNRQIRFGAANPYAAVLDPVRARSALAKLALGRTPASRIAARFAKRALFNAHVPLSRRITAAAGRADAWIIGSLGNLLEAYAHHHKLALDAPAVADLVPPDIPAPRVATPPRLQEACGRVVQGCADYLRDRFEATFDASAATASWSGRLSLLSSASAAIGERSAPSAVLLGETSKPWPKLIGLTLKRKGARVIGANHGNFLGQASMPGLAWHTYSVCDEIVCYSPADAGLLAADYAQTTIATRRHVHFAPLPGRSVMGAMASRLRASPRQGPVRSVMIIGYPMNAQRYVWSAGDYFMFQLDAELRLAALLRQAGYRVIYKMHPDRKVEAQGLFDGKVDEIILTRFEEVWQQADAFVFGNIMTTVFNVAALTDRPIVALDIDGYRWMPKVREICARRVNFVPASFDADNRLQFDPAAITGTLANPPATPDQSYAEHYLLRTVGDVAAAA